MVAHEGEYTRLDKGSSCFAFRDPAATATGQINVFVHVPERVNAASRPMLALHGLDREAASFRDVFVDRSEHLGKIVVVPEFDLKNFPSLYSYNYGNVIETSPSHRLNPRTFWSFSLVDRLMVALRQMTEHQHDSFDMYGNSAGSQFVLRYLALTEAQAVHTAISSNSGLYMVPSLEVEYPAGMGGIGLTEAGLRRYLSRRLHILLGEHDTDAGAFDLPSSPEAMAQGQHRLARGLWHYEHCKTLALKLETVFGWTVEIVPRAAHISQAIFDRAMMIAG